MLILDKNKENLLVSKYGFEEHNSYGGYKYYTFGSVTIWGITENLKNAYAVYSASFSKNTQDIIYTLIMDKVLINISGNKSSEWVLKNRIRELEVKVKELENKENE